MRSNRLFLIFVLFFVLSSFGVYAADTGLKSPTSTGSVYNQFTNPANAYSSDNNYATENRNGEQQDYYVFNFGLTTETITGINISLEGKDTSWSNEGVDVELSWNGGTSWTSTGYGATWPNSTDGVRYLGGPSDTWGRS